MFARLTALTGKTAARTCGQMRKAVGQVCERFKEKECDNVFMGAGHETEGAQCAAIRLLSADILAGELAAGQEAA